ncbi:hypothetical protein B0T09DRAFT_318581 [Sordaria sp. MPI-SDFR-AT-0083]|nr:hypothetical protein B0T09DRAFT_320093 [Sordaria sp. MPI-SDFR-AT-0083]KAH7633209.1 hypothetical protein B0T09DRAFT_318581 [Sordaria sp. MPI-SDFR-AT-0083]
MQTEKVLASISAIAAEVRQLRRDTQQRLKDQDQLSIEVVRQVLGGVAHIVTTEVTKMSAKGALFEVGENSAETVGRVRACSWRYPGQVCPRHDTRRDVSDIQCSTDKAHECGSV